MAPIGTLWGLSFQRQTKVILAAAAGAGLELGTPVVEFRVTNKSPEYLSKFPLGKVPAFEDNKGLKLFEGAAIARHGNLKDGPVCSLVPESGLLGKDGGEAALVDQWVHFGETEISVLSYGTSALITGSLGPYSKQMHNILIMKQAQGLKCLDDYLATRVSGYLVSDEMTLADIAIAAVTEQAGQITCGTTERALYPNVFTHYERVTAHAKVKEAFGEPGFVEGALKYTASTA